jgi:hypothetical protein
MASLQPRLLQIADIAAFKTTELLATDTLHLFQVGPTIGPNTTLSSLTEATFVNYSSVILTHPWLTGLDPVGNGLTKYSQTVAFSAGAITGPETEGGWYITDTLGTTLKAAANFAAPQTFANLNDTLLVQPFIFAPFSADCDMEFIAGA